MKIVISLKELKEAVAGLSRVVTSRPTLPVMGTVRISGDAEGGRITGTNLTEYLSWRIVRTADGNGLTTLEKGEETFKELKEFIKGNRKTGNVSFQVEADRVYGSINSDNNPVEHTFVRLPEKDWTEGPVFITKPEKITADALEAIMHVLPLASKDDSRRTLNGVLLEPGAIVASDGKQLVKFHEQTGVKDKVILPKTKVLTSGMLSDQDGTIVQNKCYCQIISGPWEYAVKGIAGNYPQYQHVKGGNYMLFKGDYSFRGTHADKVIELTAPFNEKGNKLFIRNLDVYLLAPIVGFLYGRKAEIDATGKTTNILYDAMSKEITALWFNYRLIMLLDKNNESDFNQRVEKAFRYYDSEQAKTDEELYECYVRGGVDILYEKLISSANAPEDYLKNLYEFLEEFEEKYGQSAEDILNLVQLARN